VLDVHLGRLRRKIDRHGRPFIRTVQGEGYCAVRHVAQQP
jgi:DNA-binding response OmpR family regulator